MKLHILNDLHIEFEDFAPPATDADVMILAGDIGVGVDGVRWAEERFPNQPVIYVPGNHEFYHHDLLLIEELKAETPDHIHVLNNDQVVIGGVRFLGKYPVDRLCPVQRRRAVLRHEDGAEVDDGFLHHPE